MNQSGPTSAGNRVTMIVAAVGCLFLSGIGVWLLLGSHDLVEEPAMIGNGDLLPPDSPPVTAFKKTSDRAIQAGVIAVIPSTQAIDTALTFHSHPNPRIVLSNVAINLTPALPSNHIRHNMLI